MNMTFPTMPAPRMRCLGDVDFLSGLWLCLSALLAHYSISRGNNQPAIYLGICLRSRQQRTRICPHFVTHRNISVSGRSRAQITKGKNAFPSATISLWFAYFNPALFAPVPTDHFETILAICPSLPPAQSKLSGPQQMALTYSPIYELSWKSFLDQIQKRGTLTSPRRVADSRSQTITLEINIFIAALTFTQKEDQMAMGWKLKIKREKILDSDLPSQPPEATRLLLSLMATQLTWSPR